MRYALPLVFLLACKNDTGINAVPTGISDPPIPSEAEVPTPEDTGVAPDPNLPPELDALANVQSWIGDPVVLIVSFSDEVPDTVAITVESADVDVIGPDDIVVSGTGDFREVTIDPSGVGTATLQLVATDEQGATDTTFVDIDVLADRSGWTGVWVYGDNGNYATASSIRVGANGDVWVAGEGKPDDRFRGMVHRLDANGDVVWTAYHDIVLDSHGRKIYVRPDGTSILAAQSKLNSSSNQQFMYLGEFTADGAGPTEFDVLDNYDGAPGNWSVPGFLDGRPDGTLAVGHYSPENARVSRYSAMGAWLFTEELGGVGSTISGVAIENDSTVYVIGEGEDTWLGALDIDGQSAWANAPYTGGARLRQVIVHDGALFTCGDSAGIIEGDPSTGGRDVVVQKYDLSGGLIWSTRLGSPLDDVCSALTPARTGGVVIGGYWNRDAQGAGSGFLAHVDDSGTSLWESPFEVAGPAGFTIATSVVTCARDILVAGHIDEATPGFEDRRAFVARFDEQGVLQ